MANTFELHRVVNLRSAQTTIFLHTEKGGDEGRVMWEVFPAEYTGNAPGVMYRIMQEWQEALTSALALKVIAEHIHNGIEVVPGTNYAPVMLYLQAAGEQGAGLRLVLTEDDAKNLMHMLTEMAEHAVKKAPITVATRLR